MQTFDTPDRVTAVLDIPAGLVRLVATDRTDTTVEVLPADAAKSRDIKAAERIRIGYADGELRIEAVPEGSRILGDSGQVEVTVQLPAGSHVRAKAALAELRGIGRLGDVAFEGAQATVNLDEAASARLAVQAGDINLGRVGGPSDLRTQKGDLTVAEATGGAVTLHTEYGDIALGAARGVSASLDAGTGHGRIRNALTHTGDTDGLTVTATTGYGDITARSI